MRDLFNDAWKWTVLIALIWGACVVSYSIQQANKAMDYSTEAIVDAIRYCGEE